MKKLPNKHKSLIVSGLDQKLSAKEKEQLEKELHKNPNLLEEAMNLAAERLVIEEKIKDAQAFNNKKRKSVVFWLNSMSPGVKAATIAACFFVVIGILISDSPPPGFNPDHSIVSVNVSGGNCSSSSSRLYAFNGPTCD